MSETGCAPSPSVPNGLKGIVLFGPGVDGRFACFAPCAARQDFTGADPVTATGRQSEYDFNDIEGTRVGLRIPGHVGASNIAGCRLHFIGADRSHGGYLTGPKAVELNAGLRLETDRRDDPARAPRVAENGSVRDR